MPLRHHILVILLALAPAAAHAGVPSPGNSSIPARIIVCPQGDIASVVTVRDFANNVVPGSQVVFDFGPCPAAAFCPSDPNQGYTLDLATRTVRKLTDAQGRASFGLRMGGSCNAVTIYADGINLGSAPLLSPDQNGDLIVNNTDFTIINGKIGSNDYTADFDGSGTVTIADMSFAQQHGGHACQNVVGTTRRTWGGVKVYYR